MVEFIGYLAGFIAMVSFLPQVVKTLRSRSAQDISTVITYFISYKMPAWQCYF